MSTQTTADMVLTLQKADDAYYNTEDSIMSDYDYDNLRRILIKSTPTHPYLIGVGSNVRGGKIKLPYPMGSLDQKYDGETIKWVEKNKLEQELFVISDKLDGVSAMIVYDELGDMQICYSRGNGTEGADITRHLKHFAPLSVGKKRSCTIRGEVIMTKLSFERLQERGLAVSKSGKPWKNPRNAVSGILNSKDGDQELYDMLVFIAYEYIDYNDDKLIELVKLSIMGFETPSYISRMGRQLTDGVLTKHLNYEKSWYSFEIDGLVITPNTFDIRNRLQKNQTRETINPAYSIKYKTEDSSNNAITKVTKVTWVASKHGYLKPTVTFEPVELAGATIRNATGFNAKFIQDNELGISSIVEITRSGDVIPYIKQVIKGTVAEMPVSGWGWNESNVDAVIIDPETNPQVQMQRVIDFFSSIDVPMLRKGNVKKLIEADRINVAEIINTDRDTLIRILGKNGGKAYDGLHAKLQNIERYELMGSTTFFGRGVGKRRLKQLFEALGTAKVFAATEDEIADVKGFDEITAKKIVNGRFHYLKWFVQICHLVEFKEKEVKATSGNMIDETVVFTGIRDKELEKDIEAAGGTVANGITGKTTMLVAKDPDSNSGKVKKARDKGIPVIDIEKLIKLLKL